MGHLEITTGIEAIEKTISDTLTELQQVQVVRRIWEHDHTVWKEDPTEISNRLGWLHCPEKMYDALPEINAFVEEIRREGFTHALLLGMGGSSLAPEVFRFTFGVKKGYLDLAVLDSTDPGAVLEQERRLDPAKTLFIVSTKSGGTIETLSFMKYFYNVVLQAVGRDQVGRHFIAITDPGSGLEDMAKELHFRHIFLNDPDIGGRFSALSYFGLVPAALIGVNVEALLERARNMTEDARRETVLPPDGNSAVQLGAFMGELAKMGRDKLTFILSPSLSPLGAWLEQLIAESTGKEGRGILPVDGEALLPPDAYATDRVFIYMYLQEENEYHHPVKALRDAGFPIVEYTLNDIHDLGSEFFRWEFATAITGMILGINPFDQPNVESAKVLAKQMMEAFQRQGHLPELQPSLKTEGIRVYTDVIPETIAEAINDFLAQGDYGEDEGAGRSYVALQAFLKPEPAIDHLLHELRTKIQSHYRVATTVGYGPRFLHSTGQLHKGDGGKGLFIQFTADMPEDAPIPEQAGSDYSTISFAVLKEAQALGDRQALLDNGRRVIRFHFNSDVVDGLRKIIDVMF